MAQSRASASIGCADPESTSHGGADALAAALDVLFKAWLVKLRTLTDSHPDIDAKCHDAQCDQDLDALIEDAVASARDAADPMQIRSLALQLFW